MGEHGAAQDYAVGELLGVMLALGEFQMSQVALVIGCGLLSDVVRLLAKREKESSWGNAAASIGNI